MHAGGAEQGGMRAEKLLQLAESMASKQLAAGGAAEGYEALMLYLHILQVQPAGLKLEESPCCAGESFSQTISTHVTTPAGARAGAAGPGGGSGPSGRGSRPAGGAPPADGHTDGALPDHPASLHVH